MLDIAANSAASGAASAASGAASDAAFGSLITPGIGTVIGAGIGAGASLLGGFLGGESSEAAAEEAGAQQRRNMRLQAIYNAQLMQMENAYNKQAATTAYERSRAEYDTRYRRTVDDLRAAGLNPLLSVNGLSAGGQPIAPMSTSSSASVGLPSSPVSQKGGILASGISGIGNAVNSALQAWSTIKENERADKLVDAQIKHTNAGTTKTKVDTVTDVVKGAGAGASAAYIGDKVLKSVAKRGAVQKVVNSAVSSSPSANSAVSSSGVFMDALRAVGLFVPQIGLAVGSGALMKKAQDEARSKGRTSFTNHMSAGW